MASKTNSRLFNDIVKCKKIMKTYRNWVFSKHTAFVFSLESLRLTFTCLLAFALKVLTIRFSVKQWWESLKWLRKTSNNNRESNTIVKKRDRSFLRKLFFRKFVVTSQTEVSGDERTNWGVYTNILG